MHGAGGGSVTQFKLQVVRRIQNRTIPGRKLGHAEAVEFVRTNQQRVQLRFQYGLGKNIDVLKAQQDYTSALIAKAQALKNFDVAQAQLLHDIGIISITTLTARTPFEG